jgi:hypothetical protein
MPRFELDTIGRLILCEPHEMFHRRHDAHDVGPLGEPGLGNLEDRADLVAFLSPNLVCVVRAARVRLEREPAFAGPEQVEQRVRRLLRPADREARQPAAGEPEPALAPVATDEQLSGLGRVGQKLQHLR